MRKIISEMNKAIKDFNLIENGDFIVVGLSGGKDSMALCSALAQYQKYSKTKFSLCAVTVDLFNGKYSFENLENFCKQIGIDFKVANSDIENIVFNIRKEKNPCSLCANLRRGILNSYAKQLGANKVALAHHNDDFVETFLLSLIYEGRINSFKPNTYLSKVDINVIRPFIYCTEKDIENATKQFPIFKNPCSIDHKTKREEMKNVINYLKKYEPNIKQRITNSILKNNN